MYDVVHLNTRGSQLAAQLISERLLKLRCPSGSGGRDRGRTDP